MEHRYVERGIKMRRTFTSKDAGRAYIALAAEPSRQLQRVRARTPLDT
jgi:hypothetical protein